MRGQRVMPAACRTLDRRLRNGRAGPVFAGFLGNSPGYSPAKPSKTDLGGAVSRYRRPKSDRLLDADLAELYGVPTKRFNEQVKRNLARFPVDFMFQLTAEEFQSLRSQFATSKIEGRWSQDATTSPGRGGRRHIPYAFTEHGAIMAATILNSPKAVEMSVFVVRAFIERRRLGKAQRAQHRGGSLGTLRFAQPTPLERKVSSHDQALAGVIDAIRQLTAPPNPKKRPIGFVTDPEENA
ncbi:MAG: ORF6N domain-containing protein [Pseudomonadota bacterium]|nr:ORF6N domain-containing protein [Pseudomonadota bacterium]